MMSSNTTGLNELAQLLDGFAKFLGAKHKEVNTELEAIRRALNTKLNQSGHEGGAVSHEELYEMIEEVLEAKHIGGGLVVQTGFDTPEQQTVEGNPEDTKTYSEVAVHPDLAGKPCLLKFKSAGKWVAVSKMPEKLCLKLNTDDWSEEYYGVSSWNSHEPFDEDIREHPEIVLALSKAHQTPSGVVKYTHIPSGTVE